MYIYVVMSGYPHMLGNERCFVPSPRSQTTVASEKDGKMSETMIGDRNLTNPYLFEPLFYTHA